MRHASDTRLDLDAVYKLAGSLPWSPLCKMAHLGSAQALLPNRPSWKICTPYGKHRAWLLVLIVDFFGEGT